MLEAAIKDMFTAKNFGTISLQMPNGQIATHVMWVDADDEHVLINTEIHRAKYKAAAAGSPINVMVWNAENPYSYAEVRGHMVGETRGEEARAHIDALAQKYMGQNYPGEIQSERVIIKVAPERQRSQ